MSYKKKEFLQVMKREKKNWIEKTKLLEVEKEQRNRHLGLCILQGGKKGEKEKEEKEFFRTDKSGHLFLKLWTF